MCSIFRSFVGHMGRILDMKALLTKNTKVFIHSFRYIINISEVIHPVYVPITLSFNCNKWMSRLCARSSAYILHTYAYVDTYLRARLHVWLLHPIYWRIQQIRINTFRSRCSQHTYSRAIATVKKGLPLRLLRYIL